MIILHECLISVVERAAAEPVVVWQLVSVPDTGYHRVLVVDELLGSLRHCLNVDGIDAGEHLGRRHAAVVGQHLSTDLLAHGGCAVQLFGRYERQW